MGVQWAPWHLLMYLSTNYHIRCTSYTCFCDHIHWQIWWRRGGGRDRGGGCPTNSHIFSPHHVRALSVFHYTFSFCLHHICPDPRHFHTWLWYVELPPTPPIKILHLLLIYAYIYLFYDIWQMCILSTEWRWYNTSKSKHWENITSLLLIYLKLLIPFYTN